ARLLGLGRNTLTRKLNEFEEKDVGVASGSNARAG
ncbi:helix-turn-helix domain-containing protein, partial [Pseudomonadota bacterium]